MERKLGIVFAQLLMYCMVLKSKLSEPQNNQNGNKRNNYDIHGAEIKERDLL